MCRCIMIAFVLLLSACAPEPSGHWTRPAGDGGGAYSRDSATCRSESRYRAEREFALDTQHLDRGQGSVFGRQSIETDIARRDATRYQQTMFENCLRGLGYEQRRPDGRMPSPLEAR